MPGILLSGSDLIYAAIYNFVTISMMFFASGLTGFDKRPAGSQSRILAVCWLNNRNMYFN